MISPLSLALAACNSSNNTVSNTLPESNGEPITVAVLDYFKSQESHGDKVVYAFNSTSTTETEVLEQELRLDLYENPIREILQNESPDVINTSWAVDGIYADAPFVIAFNDAEEGSPLRDILDTGLDIWNNNTTIVAAAGNDYLTDSASGPWALSIFPVVVGALDSTGNIADYSNKGEEVVHFYHLGESNGYTGTSFSSAYVSSMVADIKNQLPGISESSVRTLLEKNSEYDLTGGMYIQKLDELTTLDTSIDTRVRVEAVFELFEGRNPSQEELDYWVNEIDNNGLDLRQLAHDFAANGIEEGGVPPIEKMQAFYHFWLGRESNDSEIADMLVNIADAKNWGPVFDKEILDEIGPDFAYNCTFNNYEALLTVDIV